MLRKIVRSRHGAVAGALLALTAALPLPAADTGGTGAGADDGRQVFRGRCLICHSAQSGDGGGAQGPSLRGVYGRRAADVPGFPYTDALRASKLTWDAATLDRYLAAPTLAVPGTAMAVAVDSSRDRAGLVAYFQSLADVRTPPAASLVIAPASRLSADWKNDAPGRSHRIRIARLPAPFATPSATNTGQVVPRPATAGLAVPAGFHVETFATGLAGPRRMLAAANGDIFVSEMRGGRISVLHPLPDGAGVSQKDVYVDGLNHPFGLAFYPNAAQPKWLYVAETNRVTRYAFAAGDVNPHGAAEVVVADLPHDGGHITRDIAFSADGKRLYVSVGSGSNVAETMSKKTPAEAAVWDAAHGVGAAWDDETDRAAVLVFDVDRPGAPKTYATGVRNCVGLTLQPATGALWCTTNERDGLGDDLVPDYSTRVREGGYYGWPWYYLGSHEDPRLAGERPDLKNKALIPDVPYQAHSAALSLTFYVASSGKSAFPPQYVGDGFAAFHGSWNRSLRTGYKLVRVRMKDDVPTGDYADFLTGFIVDDGRVWGRPVATVELADGSLLMSDDGANAIYRISYSR